MRRVIAARRLARTGRGDCCRRREGRLPKRSSPGMRLRFGILTLSPLLALATGCAGPPEPATTTPPTSTVASPAVVSAVPRPSRIASPVATTPPPTPVALTGLGGVAFSDTRHGWAVGITCSTGNAATCDILFSTTADGGRTWAPTSMVANGITAREPVLGVRFLGRDGWIFGPGIYDTHDGGRTWTRAVTDPVEALEPYAGTVWAVRTCPPSDAGSGGDLVAPCTPLLLASRAGTDAWGAAPVQAPFRASMKAASTPFVLLERAPGNVAFIAETTVIAPMGLPGQAIVPGGGLLLVSRDLGRSWKVLQAPCTEFQGVRSPDGVHVWLLCAAGGGAGSQAKSVYVSADSGRTWQGRAVNSPGAGAAAIGSIPFAGYADTLAVPGIDEGLIGASFTAAILRSEDGGRTWSLPPFADRCIGAGFAVSDLWFVTSAVGWAVSNNPTDPAYGGCADLYITTDGGASWTPMARPF